MTAPYEELLEGEKSLRFPPAERHEEICRRLHERITASLTANAAAKLLPPRTKVELSRFDHVCPDLTLVTTMGNKLLLVAEVIGSHDHNVDTVTKKGIYEQAKIPRLWMIDPRYNNVEIYHSNAYGLALKEILALRDILSEPLLQGFQFPLDELFILPAP
jgi:Uma2 family endonuclease